MPRSAPFLSVGTVNLDRSAPVPLHRQLYLALREKILSGILLPGDRLPSSRVLADDVNLARNTVVNAYNQLISEGFLDSTVGSGTIVSASLPEELTGTISSSEDSGGSKLTPEFHNERDTRISERGIGLIDVPYLEETRLKPFTPAYPFIDERFVTVWGTLMSKAWRRMSRNQFGYPSALGYYPLREAIASYLRTARGVKCVSQQVIITDGAQQALNLTAQLLLNPGESVWIEDPSYDGAKAAFRNVPANIIPVPVDDSGMVVDEGLKREPQARLAYISPSNQFPMGVTMDLARRLQLIRWAEENNAWIVEDDYDSEFRYGGPPVMSLQGIDRSERVVYVGTFSKVLYPGLRLGYMVAPADLIEPLHAIRAHADRGSPLFEQIVLNDYMREGHFARHIRRMRKLYSERRTALIAAIEKQLGGILELSDGEAGLHIVARLPEGVDDVEVSQALRTRGYEVPCLSSYSLLPLKRGGLLFGFTALDVSEMDDAISRIRPVLMDAISRISR